MCVRTYVNHVLMELEIWPCCLHNDSGLCKNAENREGIVSGP